MTSAEYNQVFQKCTKAFAVGIIKLCELLPKTTAAFVIAKQLIRSVTSLAANYRASCIVRSDKERYAKLCIVIEEPDESQFWLEMMFGSGMMEQHDLADMLKQVTELIKVFTSYRTSLAAHIGKP